MTKVRSDSEGLFVKAGGYIARPGPVLGESHAYRMDDGGLKEGDDVKARHTPGTQITVITLSDGKKTRWHHEGETRNRGLHAPDVDDVPAAFDERGLRIF
jgi:hypothetical protein